MKTDRHAELLAAAQTAAPFVTDNIAKRNLEKAIQNARPTRQAVLTIRIPRDIYREITEAARRERQSLNQWCAEVLEEYLEVTP